MKKLIFTFFLIILNVCVFAQSTNSFNYQAIVRNAAGEAVVTQPVSFRLSILKGSTTGSNDYSEKHSTTTNQFGLVTLAIGNGTDKIGDFDAINWGTDNYFLKVEIDPAGGTAYVNMGTTQLLSVPYALYAKKADALTGGITETDPVFVTSAANGITSIMVGNWNSAYSWGNHSGLYRPLSYVPSWSEITSNPLSFVSPTNNQLLKYNSTSNKFENWTPNYLTSFNETDPIFTAWNKATGISITSSQVSDLQTTITNNAAVLTNTAKISYPNADATKVANLSGTNTGDETTASIKVKLGITTLSGSNTGDQDLTGKVDKITGKELSTNDYTTAEQTKLAGIAIGAEVNVNADWNSTIGDAQILNKPTTISGYGIIDAVSTTGDQTILGNKTFTGTITVATPINASDAVNKAYVDLLLNKISALENSLIMSGSYVKDIDGNLYGTIKIGNQIWMIENLRTTKYNDGTPIPNVTDANAWIVLNTGAYCDYNNTPSNSSTYGKLYNYYTVVDPRNLCPSGWHMPTDAEWTTLITTYLGGESLAGGKLKATFQWTSPNSGADNSSGFTALPGGDRYCVNGVFYGLGSYGGWWSSTANSSIDAWCRSLYYNAANVSRDNCVKQYGLSVRCVRN